MCDGGAGGGGALAADHLGAAAFDVMDDDRDVAAGAVEMRFHDLQREGGGDAGIERIAALFQNAHADRRRDPVGRGHDPKCAFDFGPGGEGIRIDIAHVNPGLGRRAHLITAGPACQPQSVPLITVWFCFESRQAHQ